MTLTQQESLFILFQMKQIQPYVMKILMAMAMVILSNSLQMTFRKVQVLEQTVMMMTNIFIPMLQDCAMV